MEHIKQSLETLLNLFIPKGIVECILASIDGLGIYVMIKINTGDIHLLTQVGELSVTYATLLSILVTVIIKILRYRKNG